ncbi:MAG: type II toxin-antitoxin system RelE/ParE family toxin [Kiritimatiellae bacterium]|nr:type II toxin-antitoxin system RelE/ParE family toxin [Kiritimatiellia bacterium]
MKVRWMPTASARFLEYVALLVGEAGAASAERWIAGIRAKTALLENNPLVGRQVPEVRRAEIRELIHRNHRIIYRVDQKAGICAIVALRHVRQKTTRRNFDR